jgi:catechol-2,3-dioxygenase
MITPKKLNAVILAVSDLGTSLAWYKQYFGFEKLYDVQGGVLIGSNGVEVVLSEVPSGITKKCDHANEICIRLFAMELTERDFEQVKEEFGEDIVHIDHPRYKSCIISDPDEHSIELYVDKI